MAPFVYGVSGVVGIVSLLTTRWLIGFLSARKIHCLPNERSAHKKPIPRGGGIAVAGIVLLAWASGFHHHHYDATYYGLIAGGVLVLAVSFLDDLKGLSARLRILTQVVAVGIGFAPFYGEPLFDGALPLWLDHSIVFISWLWFINLFNFMDGIDGITGVETVTIALGLFLFGLPDVQVMSLILMGSMLGFLWWNWHPAKIFLGDVGSVTIGYMLGFLLIKNAYDVSVTVSLLLPLYYLADATITLVRRLMKGEKIWQAHRQHFYQQAVHDGKQKHSAVVRRILAANIFLILSSYVALVHHYIGGVILGVASVALLLYHFGQHRKRVA